jgi:hypothetical protein
MEASLGLRDQCLFGRQKMNLLEILLAGFNGKSRFPHPRLAFHFVDIHRDQLCGNALRLTVLP